MSEFALHLVLTDPEQAKTAIAKSLGPYCRQQWEQGHARIAIVAQPEEDAKTVQQGKFLWGVVYREMSEQAQIGGQKYSAEAWHELAKRQFLPRRKKMVRVAGRARPVVSTTIGTTVGLSVRKMSAFIEQVIAFAQVDLGVRLSATRWEEYR